MNHHNQSFEQRQRLYRLLISVLGSWLLGLPIAQGQAITPRPLAVDNTYQFDQISSSALFDDPALAGYWSFSATPGQQVILEVDRLESDFDPLIWIFAGAISDVSHFALGQTEFIDASDLGFLALVDDGTGPQGYYNTQDPRIALALPPGPSTFTIVVTSFLSGREVAGVFDPNDGGDGQYAYRIRAAVTQTNPPSIVGRHVFYNNSVYDDNNAAATAADNNAIAVGKEPYTAGSGAAQYKHYTNYSRGLNGIMVDIANMPGTPTADDFQFRIGNSNNPATWIAPPAFSVASVVVTRGVGVMNSDRVTIVFADNIIRNQWLEVSVMNHAATTGLTVPDVHYWGNAIGETNTPNAAKTVAVVDITDVSGVRNHPRTGLNPAPIDFDFDFNRDRKVDITDVSLARNNPTTGLNGLRLILLP